MRQSSIKVTFTLALLAGLLVGFQNCTLSKFTGGGVADGTTSASSVGPTTTGGFDGTNPNGTGAPGNSTDGVATTGGGFDGKAMVHAGQCLGQPALDTIVLVNSTGTAANFIRSKCIDQPLPYANRIAELDMAGFRFGIVRVRADRTILSVDKDLKPDPDGYTMLPATWTVPATLHRWEILCIPPSYSYQSAGVTGMQDALKSPMISLYSYDGTFDNAFADIQYPDLGGPIPTSMAVAAGVTSLVSDTFTGEPFRGIQTGGTSPNGYSYSFYSTDQQFTFNASANGYVLRATDITGTSVSSLFNCYSELPGVWSAK